MVLPLAYTSPFIPPEWIAAHGFQPVWAPARGDFPTCRKPAAGQENSPILASWKLAPRAARGLCPYAEMLLEAADGLETAALIMATTCDQMRRAAEVIDGSARLPVFLLNVPATWQTPGSRQYYREELQRLGRFLVQLGGKAPSSQEFADAMLRYDAARQALRSTAGRLPARRFAETVLEYRGSAAVPAAQSTQDALGPAGIPLALLGGPVDVQDHVFLDLIEHSGAKIVLDASETGERTLPPPLDPAAVRADPIKTLADAYFLGIPDVFRRPNDWLYEWLGHQIALRGVRGLLLRSYLWCDLWHAEWRRIREWSPVPVLEIDVADDESSVHNRTLGRIEAFLESLRSSSREAAR